MSEFFFIIVNNYIIEIINKKKHNIYNSKIKKKIFVISLYSKNNEVNNKNII